ncbi:MAG: rRNA pseudouridine synthase [Candidatus Aenigmarchaeota archaeon]|nr:rRNA pseudouridine synthase [Candidatus Aenigmarchaeota archaeon]
MAKIRLRAYLMRSGEFGKAHDAIVLAKFGKILVNGKIVRNPEFSVKTKDKVEFIDKGQRKLLKLKPFTYIVFNKPAGFVCQKSKVESSIYELIDQIREIDFETRKTLFCVGRLDKDTEGLVIVTNDGRLSDRLMKPESHITKTYLVKADMDLSQDDLIKLKGGVTIKSEDGKHFVKALEAKLLGEKSTELVIDEGKKRQVKLMFEAIGNKVVYLKRVGIGNLRLENLDFKGRNYIILERQELEKLLF